MHLHGELIQAKYFGALEANHIALELLSVHREVGRLDIQHAASGITKHVFHVCVPGYGACILFLETDFFRLYDTTSQQTEVYYSNVVVSGLLFKRGSKWYVHCTSVLTA